MASELAIYYTPHAFYVGCKIWRYTGVSIYITAFLHYLLKYGFILLLKHTKWWISKVKRGVR